MSLAAIDLNLLLVLHTVLAERSVAGAARRLHVTPSAVSNALARLRVALADPLVVRRGRGIVPTPRAAALAPALTAALGALDQAIARAPFDPATCARTFTIAAADATQLAWLPAIAARVAAALPMARLRVVGIDSLVSLGDLASSEIDLHLGVRGKGAGVHAEPLVTERIVLVARRGHPALKRRLTRRQLGELRHVALDMAPGQSFRDIVAVAYAAAGIPRQVAVTVPSFTAAAAIAAGTDLVASLPTSLLARGAALGLRPVASPAPSPEVTILLCWHDRTHADPAVAALRDLVRAAVPRR